MTKTEIKELSTNARHQLRLNFAVASARNSTIRSFKTGAVIFPRTGNRPVSYGYSHTALYPFHRFSNMRSVHAEIHALLRASHRVDLRGATIYIATIRGKSGNIGLSAPCETCFDLIVESDLDNIVYTDGKGSFVVVRIEDVKNGVYAVE